MNISFHTLVRPLRALLLIAGVAWSSSAQSTWLQGLSESTDARSQAMGGISLSHTDRHYLYTNPSSILSSSHKLSATLGGALYPQQDASNGQLWQSNLSLGYLLHPKHALMVGARYRGGLHFDPIPDEYVKREQSSRLRPHEYTIDLGYAVQLHSRLSGYVTAAYYQVYTGRTLHGGVFSVGARYRLPILIGAQESDLNLTAAVSDLGVPARYTMEEVYNLPMRADLTADLAIPAQSGQQIARLAVAARYYMSNAPRQDLRLMAGAEVTPLSWLAVRAGYRYGTLGTHTVTAGAGLSAGAFKIDAAYNYGWYPGQQRPSSIVASLSCVF